MSTDEAENDHDYASIRFSIPSGMLLRQRNSVREWSIREQSSSGSTPNSDHNYIFQIGPIINVSPLTVGHDVDVIDDESMDDESHIVTSGSATGTYDTDTRSEDSISIVSTNSSDQTQYSEQSNSTDRTNISEPSNYSLRAPIDQSDRGSDGDSIVIEGQIIDNYLNGNTDAGVINSENSSPAKKRKRLTLEINGTPKVKERDLSDEDDGLTCPICLDNWEMTGEHRLASLKCGHLFGNSCIRRWLQESFRRSGQKVCPQCKTKAHPKEIRYLYAKRLRVIDRSEEHRMREELIEAQSQKESLLLQLATVKMSYAQVTQKLKSLESDNDTLHILLRNGGRMPSTKSMSPLIYKLCSDRNIDICKEAGCRVFKYAKQRTSLFVSQKSTQNLFPGYGLRFVDMMSFKPTNFLHTSMKLLRDISISDDQQLLAAASMETKVKLFDLRTLSASAVFKAAEKPIWSCSFGQRDSEYCMYLGSQRGSIYVYDTRFPDTYISEHDYDLSPVVQIASIPACQLFPRGGFLVCKLNCVLFYENSGAESHPIRLPIEGRFISMDFDAVRCNLLIQTRSCSRYPRARYILGKLNKVNEIPVFEVQVTFFASTNSPVMVRCSQINVYLNTLVAAYIQDSKLLSLYDGNRGQCVQSLPAKDIIYDTCPIYIDDITYLAALTETKCRLYKLNVT